MSKQISFDEKARLRLKGGIDKVADAVKITIGPRGRNVVLDKGYGAPTITNDGVTIAKDISLTDKFENMGAEIIKEVASKTNDTAGDGTTTAVVLTQAIITEGMRQIAMGVNAMGVRLGIEHAARAVIAMLKKMAKPIKTKSEIMQVATISAESSDIGTIIADTIEKVGQDGVVTVEESQSLGIESDVVKGLEFDKGYVSAYMVTNAERMESEFKDAPILITDKKISTVKDILPLLERLAESGRKELVIVAEDVDGEALATFVVNKLRGAFNVLAVKAPGFGDRKKDILEDIAAVTGGKLVSEDVGIKLESADIGMLGHAQKVIATKEKTTIVGGKGKKSDIAARVEQLKKLREQTDSKFDKEKLDERIGKLSGGVAVIRVGAATETEMKYLKLKIEDAVAATKAAIEEGIVPGGGTALVKAGKAVDTKHLASPVGSFDEEFAIGASILLKSLDAPLRQIAKNSGKGDGSVIVEKITASKSAAAGYDALKDEIVSDMVAAGIVDPVKVERSALENAASAAAIFLTTEAAVTDEPEEKKETPGMPGMGGGMPDMY